jgi:hypothetical protein
VIHLKKVPYFVFAIMLALLISACRKHDVTNTTDEGTNTNGTNENKPGPVGYDIKGQLVKLGIYNNNLLMSYTENINLVISPDSLRGSYNVIFDEDFSKSNLANFTFTTLTAYNTVVTNYLDNNLNNINLTSKKDTTVNGTLFTKLSFSRTLYYTTAYPSYNAAYVEYQYLLTQKDTLSYTSYITYPTRKSKASTVKVGLTYVQ